jgi:DNA polymerase-3 subunit gamma/tau
MAKRKPASASTNDTPPDPTTAREGYTVLARRYRPQLFGDLVGQEPVAQALVNAIESNRVAHAYLFTGARGVGKTSTARILAKALNCEKGPTVNPCNACDSCRAVAVGEDVDVEEIDGASNRGIDEVRLIRQNVQLRPTRSRFKIYIIDEVHMLTTPAFNALLKTLEEPPPHVKFLFATTEVQKIPVTILSRCQRFDFAGISTPRIVTRLKEIVTGEGLEADDDALELVARRAGGSMRDAQSLLDQLLAFAPERLTAEQVHRLLGTANEDRVTALAGAVLDRDPSQALALLATAVDEGLQLGELLDQLIEYWRDLMVVNCAGPEGQTLSVTGKHRAGLVEQARHLKPDTILAGLDILTSAKARLRGSSHGRVLLEMALVRLGRLEDLVSLAQLVQQLGQVRNSPAAGEAVRPAVSSATPQPTQDKTVRLPEKTPQEGVKKKQAAGTEPGVETSPLALTVESLPEVWQQVLAQVGQMLGKMLADAELPAISGPNALVLRFPSRYNFQRERCQEPAQLSRIEAALRKITGRTYSLRIEAGPALPDVNASPAQDGRVAETSPERTRRQRDEALQAPLIQRAMETLGAQVIRVDDGFSTAPMPAGRPGETVLPEEA